MKTKDFFQLVQMSIPLIFGIIVHLTQIYPITHEIIITIVTRITLLLGNRKLTKKLIWNPNLSTTALIYSAQKSYVCVISS